MCLCVIQRFRVLRGINRFNAPHFAARPAVACICDCVFRTILLHSSFVGLTVARFFLRGINRWCCICSAPAFYCLLHPVEASQSPTTVIVWIQSHGIIMSYLYVRAPALCLADVISSVFFAVFVARPLDRVA